MGAPIVIGDDNRIAFAKKMDACTTTGVQRPSVHGHG
jgi:hypothetical protein